jgi:hypothetical protein
MNVKFHQHLSISPFDSIPEQIIDSNSIPEQIIESNSIPEQIIDSNSIPEQIIDSNSIPEQIIDSNSTLGDSRYFHLQNSSWNFEFVLLNFA